jgi:uncharacterized protein
MSISVSGFQWDDGNWPKCAKHGLSKAEIEYVLSGEPVVLMDRTIGLNEIRYNAVGRNASGRTLFIVFTLRRDDEVLVIRTISARYMHAKEIERYEQRIQK